MKTLKDLKVGDKVILHGGRMPVERTVNSVGRKYIAIEPWGTKYRIEDGQSMGCAGVRLMTPEQAERDAVEKEAVKALELLGVTFEWAVKGQVARRKAPEILAALKGVLE